ncbi:RHS repeat domain-containing protein [Bacillus subtilis]
MSEKTHFASKLTLVALSTSMFVTGVGTSYANAEELNKKLVETYDDSGAKLYYTYDDKGNIIKETTKDKNNKVINELTYEYNDQNQVVKIIDFDKNVTEYAYNEAGQVVKIKNPEKDEIKFNLDDDGEVSSLSLNKTDKYTVKKSNYVDKEAGEKEDDGTVVGSELTDYAVQNKEQGLNKVTTLDDLSRLRELHTDDGDISWEYNQLALSSIKVKNKSNDINENHKYDEENNLISIASEDSKTDIEYNDQGQPISYSYKNGLRESLTYNEQGVMTEKTVFDKAGNVLSSDKYEYDEKGNIVSDTTKDDQIEYKYDDNNQLLQETSKDQIIKYSYDVKGNRISKEVTDRKTGKVTLNGYTFNKLNQFESQGSSYNDNGQLIENDTFKFTWDEAGRLVEVTNKKSGENIKYKYDEYSRRIQKQVGDEVTNYVYDDSNNKVIYETDANHNITKYYTYLKNGEVNSVKDFSENQTFYYHHNLRGDVIEITDEKGQVVANYKYDSWGNITEQTGYYAKDNDINYAGYKYDKETGLYYLENRYYNPSTAVFLSRDAWYGTEDQLVTQNGYNYANNNPLRYYDPTGNTPIALAAVAIPGVGEVVIGAAAIYLGYLGVKSLWSHHRSVLRFDIPGRLLESDSRVDLGAFNQKVKGKKAYKNPKTGWTIEKDNAGHGGRKWKLKDKSGKRVASLDGKGKILSK